MYRCYSGRYLDFCLYIILLHFTTNNKQTYNDDYN